MPDKTSESTEVAVRAATIDEIDTLIQLRRAMFDAMGYDREALTQAIEPMRDYFQKYLPTDDFRVWVAEVRGAAIASIGIVIHSIPPSPKNTSGKEAYIMNLVTLPEFRRRGIAKKLMLHALEIIRSEGIPTVSLHASAEGRRLYEQLGFAVSEAVPEMHLTLRQ